MANYNYVISQSAFNNIDSFYQNVALKYPNTYSFEQMARNIHDAYHSMYKIENGLLRRTPTISRWKGYFMANTKKWFYAYTITENEDGTKTINVIDACHAQNMHESIELHVGRIISETINNYLKKNLILKKDPTLR